MSNMARKTAVGARIDSDNLVKLEEIGRGIVPKPLNRSEMLNVAVREYVDRHHRASPAKARQDKPRK
jgi:hypothetical protein